MNPLLHLLSWKAFERKKKKKEKEGTDLTDL